MTTLRYAHLSPGHQLDAVQRLNAPATVSASSTTSSTCPSEADRRAGAASVEVLDTQEEIESGGAQNRTGDL
jgi:hypothetical protein